MAIAMLMSGELFAGGILTNTNTSVAFNRNFARDGVIAIDYALEKETATHCSVLALRIPGTGEPGGLPSMGLHRVGHD